LTIPDKLSDIVRVKYWEIIADNLSKAGWSWGRVSAVDSHGRTIFVADAHRGDGQRLLCERMKSWPRFSNLNQRFGAERQA